MMPESLPGRRFALVADTHDAIADWKSALATLAARWGEVDGVLHCGDVTTPAALDDLQALAPVRATRSNDDPPAAGPRLEDGPRSFRIGDLTVGLVFSLGEGPIGADTARNVFGGPVDVCVYGGSHQARVASVGGVLFVNLGSPTLARQRSTAVLTIDGAVADVEILAL